MAVEILCFAVGYVAATDIGNAAQTEARIDFSKYQQMSHSQSQRACSVHTAQHILNAQVGFALEQRMT